MGKLTFKNHLVHPLCKMKVERFDLLIHVKILVRKLKISGGGGSRPSVTTRSPQGVHRMGIAQRSHDRPVPLARCICRNSSEFLVYKFNTRL